MVMTHSDLPAARRPAAALQPSPEAGARVEQLIARMTLQQKLAQLVTLWVGVGSDGSDVAPMQHENVGDVPPFETYARDGLGQLGRFFGTRPVDPAEGSRALARTQQWLREHAPEGIAAVAHEECLSGFMAWGATVFPVPLAWGCSWDEALVERMASAIGTSMRLAGAHQGLAPVLDVVRDARWGRVEECIGEDPHLVGVLGTAYVRGLQREGIVATLKHFAGHSGSAAGRNLAPVSVGRRELSDVYLPPFEMAIRSGGAASVMHSYTDLDGVPSASDEWLLTTVLREQWGFDGTVVADYFGITFLQTLHGVAGTLGEAAVLALRAGIDVETPNGQAYLAPLADAVRSGQCPEQLVDRALRRVLRQKAALGLLDAPPDLDGEARPAIDLDPPEHRAIARQLAEESIVLLSNSSGVLPLAGSVQRLAVIGPNADSWAALMGDYSFPNHILPSHPGTELGIEVPTVLQALRREFSGAEVVHETGCEIAGDDDSRLDAAAAAALGADVAVVVVGDRSGLFGRGTVGEGNDRDSLGLPGRQGVLVDRLIATGTPVVLVALTGRPYALGRYAGSCAAVVQAFFPGEEGAGAIAGVLSGRVNPSGRLPVSIPTGSGGQPGSYLHTPLAGPTQVSEVDPDPAFCFGYGLSYTTFGYSGATVETPEAPLDGRITVSCRVRNTGNREGSEVVQLYYRDPVASVVRPVRQLAGWARATLAAGETAAVVFDVPVARLGFTARDLRKVVEPGEIEFFVGPSVGAAVAAGTVALVGDEPLPVPDAALARVTVSIRRD